MHILETPSRLHREKKPTLVLIQYPKATVNVTPYEAQSNTVFFIVTLKLYVLFWRDASDFYEPPILFDMFVCKLCAWAAV